MDIILKGSWVLTKEWNSIFSILGILFLGSGIAILWARLLFGDDLTFADFFALGIGGGWTALFPAILLTVLFHFLGIPANFITICAGILMISGIASYWWKPPHFQVSGSSIASALALLAIFIITLSMRLAFIAELIMPPYFDSAMHHSVIQGLITNFKTLTFPDFSSFVGGYYHLGFHVLAATLSLSLGVDVKDVILIFGQIILAFIPLPLFFIINRETQQAIPALFGTVLAEWGWSFPAHAVNWGKYPALSSILTFEIVICSIYLVMRARKGQRWLIVSLAITSALISTFIHTRSLLLIGFAILSSLIALGWFKLNRPVRYFSFFLAITILAALILIARTKSTLGMAFDPYQAGGFWVSLLVLAFVPFAAKKFPRATLAAIIFLIFVFGSLFVSVVPFLPAYDVQTLLDRPYVEMILFLPMAFLGSLGYAGMIETMRDFGFLPPSMKKWFYGALALIFFSAVWVNTSRYSFLPSDCCNFFGQGDAAALGWMDKNLPANANILIASAQAVVFENTPSAQYAGSDSGIWITPLIHRNSTPFPYYTDFSQQETLDKLCKSGITYIYVGEKGTRFNQGQLDTLPAWYETLLHLSKAQVYKLAACP